MADNGAASIQFNTVQVRQDPNNHRAGVEIGRENEREAPIALSSQSMTSADQMTAWRVRRSGVPVPLSKRTAGSLYNWDKN